MYINSNFNDYYDFYQKMGQDPKIVYNRKTKRLPHNIDLGPMPALWDEDKFDLSKWSHTYRLLDRISSEFVREYNITKNGYHKNIETRIFLIAGDMYIMDEDNNFYTSIEDAYIAQEDKVKSKKRYEPWYLKRFFTRAERLKKEHIENLHRHFDAPIIMINDRNFTLNPNLKQENFGLDAYEVWTKVFNFFQAEEPEIVEVDDKYKAKAHGYDKHSFRKDPGGPTRKRNKK